MNIVDAMDDPAVFGPWFAGRASWAAWRVVLRALFALPMPPADRALYARLTGRDAVPTIPAEEGWLIVGRRGGKSHIVALIATYLAAFVDFRPHLSPGERGVLMVIASDRKQARVIFRFVVAFMRGVPMLDQLILSETKDSLQLSNGIDIEVHTASFRTVRGYTIVAALCDEIAFWRDDASANPDYEILDAIRPAMATIPGALLLGLGTPYRRSGVLHDAHRDHFGHDDSPVLVVRADTATMNSTVAASVIARAYERDPQAAAAEYGAEFRSDIAGFLDPDWIDCAVRDGPPELPAVEGVIYQAVCDPSGGRNDSFTLGIAHNDNGRAVLDVARAVRPPFNPTIVVAEYADVLRRYGLHEVMGDHYSAEWVAEAFRAHDISYLPADRPKSALYLEVGPLFATGAVSIPDNRMLLTELRQLERRVRAGGKDVVDHPSRGHDDLANAACGALFLAQDAPIDLSDDDLWQAGRQLDAYQEWDGESAQDPFIGSERQHSW